MISRFDALAQLVKHAYYGPLIKRTGTAVINEFIKNNDDLSHSDFERMAQRLFLDRPVKPRMWSAIEDVLVAVNNIAFGNKKGTSGASSEVP